MVNDAVTETYPGHRTDKRSDKTPVLPEIVIVKRDFSVDFNIFQRLVGDNTSQDSAPLRENRDLNGSIREVYV